MKNKSYGDEVRKSKIDGDYNSYELLDKNDYRTPWDINRPVLNIIDEIEDIEEFMKFTSKLSIFPEGVFENSLSHSFNITAENFEVVDLDGTTKYYAKLSPGIGAFGINKDLFVYKPNIRLAERQIAEIIDINYHPEREGVWIKYDLAQNKHMCKITKRQIGSNDFIDYYFGCNEALWDADDFTSSLGSASLLENIYNNPEFTSLMFAEIGTDLTKIELDKFFEYTDGVDGFFAVKNGELSYLATNTDDTFFYLGSYVSSAFSNDYRILDGSEIEFGKPGGSVKIWGDTTYIKVQEVEIEDNMIVINKNEIENYDPPIGLLSGIRVYRGIKEDYKFIFRESDQTFVIGELGDYQPVATREDIPINEGVAFWDEEEKRFITSENLKFSNVTEVTNESITFDAI